MKKQSITRALRMLLCIVISFVVIYLLVFFGGWKLLESGDPILVEIAISIPVGILLGVIVELSKYFESELNKMASQIQELEKQLEELRQKQG